MTEQTIRVFKFNDGIVIDIFTDITIENAPCILRKINKALKFFKPLNVIFNLKGIHCIFSIGMGIILSVYDYIRKVDGQIIIIPDKILDVSSKNALKDLTENCENVIICNYIKE